MSGRASPRIRPVCDGAMADRRDADRLFVLGQLVDDAVGTDPQRTKAAQATAQLVSGEGFSLEQAESVFDGVDEWPAEVEQFVGGAPGKEDPCHASAGCAAVGEFGAQGREGHGFVSR